MSARDNINSLSYSLQLANGPNTLECNMTNTLGSFGPLVGYEVLWKWQKVLAIPVICSREVGSSSRLGHGKGYLIWTEYHFITLTPGLWTSTAWPLRPLSLLFPWPGNTNLEGRISTVDLLIKVACIVSDSFNIKRSWSKLGSTRRSTVLNLPLQ